MACYAPSACGGQTTAHFISQPGASSQWVALGHPMGAGEKGLPEEQSGTGVNTWFVYLLWFCLGLTLIQGIESLLLSFQLSKCGKKEENIVSCSLGVQISNSSFKLEEEGEGGGLGCLGPKRTCLPACVQTLLRPGTEPGSGHQTKLGALSHAGDRHMPTVFLQWWIHRNIFDYHLTP